MDGQLSMPMPDETAEARALREEGIKRAYEAALAEWKKQCLGAIYDVARDNRQFTTDLVWLLLDERKVPPTHENRAISGVLRDAVREGFCKGSGVYTQSTLARGHQRLVQIYESLIYDPDPAQLTLT